MHIVDIIIAAARVVIVFSIVLGLVPVLIWMERKGAAFIQDRRGPNRAQILGVRLGGLVHSFADALKLLTKEEVAADAAFRPLYFIAPVLAFFVAAVTIAVVPFTEPLSIAGRSFALQVADLRPGLIYIFAMSSLGVYAILLAGWASGNKFSLLGALRAASQMVSYELAMGMAALAIFIVAGSLSLADIVADQGDLPWRWNAIRQPLAFVLFFTALLAEANRLPFDLPEGESEIVAGYHTEYSSMRFAMFFMAEYAHLVAGSAVVAALFFGGWQIPFVGGEMLRANAAAILNIAVPATGVLAAVAGAALIGRFKRRCGDLRDYETLVFGVPMFLGGLLIVLAYQLARAFGGLTLPAWSPAVVAFLIQLGVFLAKTVGLCAVFIWIRWTLPRFRYDQVMKLGWRVMLPLGMANVAVTAALVLKFG